MVKSLKVLLGCLSLLFACERTTYVDAPTQVIVRVRNHDSELLAEMIALRVSVARQDGERWVAVDSATIPIDRVVWPADIPVFPSSSESLQEPFEVVVEALKHDTVLAQTRAVTRYVEDQWRLLELWLFRCPDDRAVCAEDGCHGETCAVCSPTGSCVLTGITEPAELLTYEPDEDAPHKPVPGWPGDLDDGGPDATGAGGDAAADAGTDAQQSSEEDGVAPSTMPEGGVQSDGGEDACQDAKTAEEQCTCAGDTWCEASETCVDTTSDPKNCGRCGYACAEGLACEQGECEQRIRELALGGNSSCALFDSPDGVYPLKCWGSNAGSLFRDESVLEALAPRRVVGVPAVRAFAFSASGNRQCFVPPDEDVVRCWGQCAQECGNAQGTTTTGSTFSNDVSLVGLQEISLTSTPTGGSGTCGRTSVGNVYCWGSAIFIASSENTHRPQLVDIGGEREFTKLAGYLGHTCAIVEDGRVACWGYAGGNALGVARSGAITERGVIVPREDGTPLAEVTKISVGVTTCAITTARQLWCWGPNDGKDFLSLPGILGVGDMEAHEGAVRLDLANVADVSLGHFGRGCAIAGQDEVYCWGHIHGIGTGAAATGNEVASSPQHIPGLTDAVEIQTSGFHTCARRRNGEVLCWGSNTGGQLGDGTKVERLSPTIVKGLYE